MAVISLIRIDDRLIHGQIVTRWVKVARAQTIVVIDNALDRDPFMKGIYKNAAPSGTSVIITNIDEGLERWQRDAFGGGNAMLIFGNVGTCYQVYRKGFPMHSVQLGNLSNKEEAVKIAKLIALTPDEIKMLREMEEEGVEVSIHNMPEEAALKFAKATQKIK